MAASAYPHMIFGNDKAELDKDRLVALLDECVPGGESEQSALKLTWTRDGYAFTFWFEDADRVGEMYADYLPDGARRRPLVNATTVIDMSGDADEEGAQADTASTITAHLAEQDGVHVFSEATKRFVGMSYGDEPEVAEEASAVVPQAEAAPGVAPAETPAPEAATAPEVEPVAEAPAMEVPAPMDAPSEEPVAEQARPEEPVAEQARPEEPVVEQVRSPEAGAFAEPGVQAQPQPQPSAQPEPESAPGTAAPEAEPVAEAPAMEVPAPVDAPSEAPVVEEVRSADAGAFGEPGAQAQPPAQQEQPEPERKGFFKRMFGRR